jgi:hypothetical protein
VAWKVVDFLESNPSEELTRHDIAEKFDIDPVQVDDVVRTVVNSGHIVRELNDESVSVWRLNFSKRGIPKPFAISLAEAKKARRANRKPPVAIDFSALVIEKEIALIENSRKGSSEWDKLLGRMDTGDSVLLPIGARDAAAHAYAAFRRKHPATKFSVRKVGQENCRIWRLA